MENTNAEKSTMKDTAARASNKATNSVDRAADAAHPAVDQIAGGVHDAVDKLASGATQVAEAFDAKGGQLKDVLAQFSESCRTHVREKPITSLGMTMAAGFLLSWLLRKR